MTNIFNYRFKNIVDALIAIDKLESKIKNNANKTITLPYSDKGYWVVRLKITNEQSDTTKTRVFNTTA